MHSTVRWMRPDISRRHVAMTSADVANALWTCLSWSQCHEYPKDDDADCCHQNEVAVSFQSFHCQCLLYIEALMAIPAIPRMVPASIRGSPRAGRRPLVALSPVLRFVRSRQRFVRRCHEGKGPSH